MPLLQNEVYLLIEEKTRLLNENNKLSLKKQKEMTDDNVEVDKVSQKKNIEKVAGEKVTFPLFQTGLDKYLKEEITKQ